MSIRVPEGDLKRWRARAERLGLSLSVWARRRLNVLEGEMVGGRTIESAESQDVPRRRYIRMAQRRANPSTQAEGGVLRQDQDSVIARKMGHETGCDCVGCTGLRKMAQKDTP